MTVYGRCVYFQVRVNLVRSSIVFVGTSFLKLQPDLSANKIHVHASICVVGFFSPPFVMFPISPKLRRLQLLRDEDVPSQTEVESYLGSSLAQVFKHHSDDPTKTLLGVIPPLEGYQNEVWISPSDQLIGKVALKPPLTNKCIKACTHQGILEIGELAALRFERKTEEIMRNRLEEEMVEIRKMFDAEKRRAVEVNVKKIRDEHDEHVKNLNEEFAKKLKMALEEAKKISDKEMQRAVLRERMEVTLGMMKKLRDEVGLVVDSLEVEFQETLRAQRLNMIADFNAIMRRERSNVDATMKSLEQTKTDELFAQRRELEMQNIADAACILCTERMRCGTEKHEMHQCFQKQIEALQNLLTNSTKKLSDEEMTNEKKIPKPSNPSAEFFQVTEIIDKDGQKWRPIDYDPEIAQLDCTEIESEFSISPSKKNLFPSEHYDRTSKPSVTSLRSYESLPFCYVEDKLYVRSDRKKSNEVNVEETKKMSELAEGAHFTINLKKSPTSCYQQRN